MSKRGKRLHERKHARNFIQQEAQKRLDETVPAFNRQTLNALDVNAVEIDYYAVHYGGRPCTCEQVEMLPEFTENREGNTSPIIKHALDNTNQRVEITLQEDIFGEAAEQDYTDDVLSVMDEELHIDYRTDAETNHDNHGSVPFEDGVLAGNNVKCGICYRRGISPAYTALNKNRYVFTNFDIENIDGYFIDRTDMPHKFKKQIASGFVEYSVTVPKYFKSLTYSIRNNIEELFGVKLYDTSGTEITRAILDSYRGKTMRFRVTEREFTHTVLEFDLGAEKVRGNLSGESVALDYRRLDTNNIFTVILPPTIPVVSNQDVLIIPKRGLALKVTNVTPRQTATKRLLEWEATARVIQPTEDVKRIHTGYKL